MCDAANQSVRPPDGTENRPRVASLHIYPLKAVRGLSVAQAVVEPWGLSRDRRWMLVDEQGRFLSQRQEPRLALVTALPLDRDAIHLSAPGMPTLRVAAPQQGSLVTATLWRDRVGVIVAPDPAQAWFRAFLGRDVRLVYQHEPAARKVDIRYGRADDSVSLADGYPLLLTTTASLAALNRLMSSPVPMNRFRPNVTVAGTGPWEEDGWARLRIGEVVFRAAKPCARCVVTTIDQRTGARGDEPLRTLARHRRIDGKAVFGQNLIPESYGTIRVGDVVEVL